MATKKQIAANRRNAKKSTGPRTENGKAVSAQNALKTGIDAESMIIGDESAEDLEALTAEYIAQFQPATPQERFLVDALISSDWLRRRLVRVEPQLWNLELRHDRNPALELGIAFSNQDQTLARLQRRLDSALRTYK